MFADIAHGHTDLADALYLLAAVLFGLAALAYRTAGPLRATLAYAGAAVLAVAFLVL